MCVLVRPFIRRTLIVAGKKTKDRFPLKAQFLDFSGFDEDRRIFQSFILDARYANDSQVCTTIAGKTFLPIKSFSCGHEVWCECSSNCSNEEVVTIKCLQFVFYQLAAIFVIDPTLDKTQRWSSILRRVFPCGQRFSWVFLRKKLKIQRFLILSKNLVKSFLISWKSFCNWQKLHIAKQWHSNLSLKVCESLWKQIDRMFDGKSWGCSISWFCNCFVLYAEPMSAIDT